MDNYNYAKRGAQHTPVASGKRHKMGPADASKDSEERSKDSSPLIVRFYDPVIRARDARNRTLEEILSWSNSKLESCHDYIQMLFPLPEGSYFNFQAPLIDRAVMEAFRSRRDLQMQLRQSFKRMLDFYGFQVSTESPINPEGGQKAALGKIQTTTSTDVANSAEDSTTNKETPSTKSASSSASNPRPYSIVRAPNWRKQCRNWAVPFNHNHLRISRIIRCLRVLGLEREAAAFFAALERVYEDPQIMISEKSMGFWRLAATRPLHLAPDGEKSEWLETWEKEQEALNKATNPSEDVQKQQQGGDMSV